MKNDNGKKTTLTSSDRSPGQYDHDPQDGTQYEPCVLAMLVLVKYLWRWLLA